MIILIINYLGVFDDKEAKSCENALIFYEIK